MPLVPATLQSSIIAGRTALGPVIDSAVKAKASGLPPSAAASAGQQIWGEVLKIVYSDLDQNLASKIPVFLSSMIVTYSGVPSTAIFPPPVFTFSSKAQSDGILIDTQAKAKTAALPPNAVASAGQIIWQTAFQIVYITFNTVVSQALGTTLTAATSIVPPGAATIAPPGVVIAPTPALVIPSVWNSGLLSAQLIPVFSALPASDGPLVDSSAKAKTSALAPAAAATAGQMIWEEFSKQLTFEIANNLSTILTTFLLSGSGSVFNIAPGTPITIPSPPFTGVNGAPVPAIIT